MDTPDDRPIAVAADSIVSSGSAVAERLDREGIEMPSDIVGPPATDGARVVVQGGSVVTPVGSVAEPHADA